MMCFHPLTSRNDNTSNIVFTGLSFQSSLSWCEDKLSLLVLIHVYHWEMYVRICVHLPVWCACVTSLAYQCKFQGVRQSTANYLLLAALHQAADGGWKPLLELLWNCRQMSSSVYPLLRLTWGMMLASEPCSYLLPSNSGGCYSC